MIKEATYYEMYCDRCGKQLDDGDIVAYKEKEGLEFVAGESEWQTIEGKHFVCLISICDAAKCSLYLDRSERVF